MQNRLLKVAFFITFTELIMGLIVGAYFKLSYFLAPPKEPSMGAGYGMLFATFFPPTTGKYWMAYPYDLLTASGSDYHISIITT